jgi:hypothetical protein
VSRRVREGRYLGTCRGRHLRSARPLWVELNRVDSNVAWAEASRRAHQPFPVHHTRQRYNSKAERAKLGD